MTKLDDNLAPGETMPTAPGKDLQVRIMQTGERLLAGLSRAVDSLPDSRGGPQALARRLGVDKVLASRVLKMVRSGDPMAAIHRAPGPDPLRRVVRAMVKAGVDIKVTEEAVRAIEGFERLIVDDVGDRSSLDTILSAWVPEARRDFELRRKQTAFRAISQLKGVQAEVFAEAAIFWPSADGEHLDVVWIKSLSGLTRVRPGVTVKFTSVRGVERPDGRRPLTLSGERIDSVKNTVIPEFCSNPTPELTARVVGEQTHYLLESMVLGESVQIVTCEVNRSELPRFLPGSRGRRAWASTDIAISTQRCQLDVLVHTDVFPREDPDLRVYDTAVLGTADRNDSARDVDILDLLEKVDNMGVGIDRFGSSDVPRYRKILEHVCERLGFDGTKLRGYRVVSDYPLYGSQYAMSFRTTDPPP